MSVLSFEYVVDLLYLDGTPASPLLIKSPTVISDEDIWKQAEAYVKDNKIEGKITITKRVLVSVEIPKPEV